MWRMPRMSAKETFHLGFATRLAAGLLVVAAALAMQRAGAQDPMSVAGGKIAVCVTCHGVDGVSQNPLYPHINGQFKEYLIKSMTQYRDGTRQDVLMTPMAAGLTDAEIEELAEHYSKQ